MRLARLMEGPFIAMAYVEGSELGDEIERGPLAIDQMAKLGRPKSYAVVS